VPPKGEKNTCEGKAQFAWCIDRAENRGSTTLFLLMFKLNVGGGMPMVGRDCTRSSTRSLT